MKTPQTYKGFLSNEQCEFIINNCTKNLKKAKIGSNGKVDESVRKANENNIVIADEIFEKINNIIDEHVINITNVELEEKINNFKFIEYPAGGYYKWHKDSSPNTEFENRLVSIVIQLNEDYIGGELLYKTPNGEFKFEKGLGNLYVFPSSLPHSVTEVISGKRYSIVNWYNTKSNNIKKTNLTLI